MFMATLKAKTAVSGLLLFDIFLAALFTSLPVFGRVNSCMLLVLSPKHSFSIEVMWSQLSKRAAIPNKGGRYG